MTAVKRRLKWLPIPAALCLISGLDIAPHLRKTADLYDGEVASLEEAEKIFPSRGAPKIDLKDSKARKAATRPIREAYAWEKKAIEMLDETLEQI